MALSPDDIKAITDLVDARIAGASVPHRAPRAPSDLVYEGNGNYYSSSTKMGYSKGAGGILIPTGVQD
jgi:hypothetical protein